MKHMQTCVKDTFKNRYFHYLTDLILNKRFVTISMT